MANSMNSYTLVVDSKIGEQHHTDHSFIGGFPRLPKDKSFPVCHLCGEEQTFFFQVAFPSDHTWRDLSLAVFACTHCEKEGYLIPKMPSEPLRGINLEDDFFVNYEINFCFLTFNTGMAVIRQDYIPKVKFKKWILQPDNSKRSHRSKIGGSPIWISRNEAPSTYSSNTPFTFLLHIQENYKFEILPDAPRQRVLDYYGNDGATKLSTELYYELFIGNALYLFGAQLPQKQIVYAIVQR